MEMNAEIRAIKNRQNRILDILEMKTNEGKIEVKRVPGCRINPEEINWPLKTIAEIDEIAENLKEGPFRIQLVSQSD